ncbi:hypothetical protein GDO81_021285 [Engystomops pustulosus]|uniref:FZ domain-containing protein n=1 Tax=Engystomops pustulosus TaxID=76066 RepID=A0AAV6Z7S0_ENGPU|nr:hypothetical protein GDO81_021285 [Engystomops pustulosus]
MNVVKPEQAEPVLACVLLTRNVPNVSFQPRIPNMYISPEPCCDVGAHLCLPLKPALCDWEHVNCVTGNVDPSQESPDLK